MKLSLWQLSRAHEKELLEKEQSSTQQTMIESDLLKGVDNNLKQVRLTGHFLNEQTVFIDNQLVNHVAGYDVLTPFKTKQNHIFWVNRGWIKGPGSRTQLPEVLDVNGQKEIQVRVLVPKKRAFRLGSVRDPSLPKRLQVLDLKVLNQLFESSLSNSVMILQRESPGSLVYHYQSVVVPASRHYGYAVQWFGIAIIWLIFTVYANF